MTPASDFLRALNRGKITDEDLEEFLRHLSGENVESRQEAFDHLLAVMSLGPQQTSLLETSETVQSSGGLLLSLRRYVSSKEYARARDQAEKEPNWKFALRYVGNLLWPF